MDIPGVILGILGIGQGTQTEVKQTEQTENDASIFGDTTPDQTTVVNKGDEAYIMDCLTTEETKEDEVNPFVDLVMGFIESGAHEYTKDGEIDTTKQQGTGDCWLLSGVNALSYTEEGRQIIKDALSYQDNGDIVVNLKGVGEYTVTKQEIREVRANQKHDDRAYSKGDDDMLAFELAIEKVNNDFINRNIMYKDAPSEFSNIDELKEDLKQEDGKSIEGGYATESMYLITGKRTEYIKEKDEMNKALDEFDGKTVALAASVSGETKKAIDINGQEVELPGDHAYAIKNVEGDTVTVVNPWNSRKEIVISRDVFLENFSKVEKCDLTSDDVKYVENPDEVDKDGNKTYKKEAEDFITFSNLYGDTIDVAYTQKTYDASGEKLLETAEVDKDGNKLTSMEFDVDKDGNKYLKEQKAYFQDGKRAAVILNDENGDFDSYKIEQYNENGDIKEMVSISSREVFNNVNSRNLFGYEQFSLTEVDSLAHYTNEEWTIAENYLKENKDATYSEIAKAVDDKTNPADNKLTKNPYIKNMTDR